MTTRTGPMTVEEWVKYRECKHPAKWVKHSQYVEWCSRCGAARRHKPGLLSGSRWQRPFLFKWQRKEKS